MTKDTQRAKAGTIAFVHGVTKKFFASRVWFLRAERARTRYEAHGVGKVRMKIKRYLE